MNDITYNSPYFTILCMILLYPAEEWNNMKDDFLFSGGMLYYGLNEVRIEQIFQ